MSVSPPTHPLFGFVKNILHLVVILILAWLPSRVPHLCLLTFVDFIFTMYLRWLPLPVLSLSWKPGGLCFLDVTQLWCLNLNHLQLCTSSQLHSTLVVFIEMKINSYCFLTDLSQPFICLTLFSDLFLMACIPVLYPLDRDSSPGLSDSNPHFVIRSEPVFAVRLCQHLLLILTVLLGFNPKQDFYICLY